jgi:hypothetical protein
MRGSFLAALPLHALLTAIASAQSRPPANPAAERLPGHVVDVSAGEFFLRSPDSIPAGLTTFRLRQIGDLLSNPEKVRAENLLPATPRHDPTRTFHMLWVVRLEPGRTVDEWYQAKVRGEPTPWASNLGGPASADPPRTSNATLVLEPGTYALVCYVGSARQDKNRSHLLKGMFRPLTVVRSMSGAVEPPQPEVTARITGSGQIELSGPVRKGRQLIRVVNQTAKPHEFIVARVKKGRSAEETTVWTRAAGTTHPFDSWGGLSVVRPGATLTTTILFEPGSYLLWTIRAPATSVAVTVSGG